MHICILIHEHFLHAGTMNTCFEMSISKHRDFISYSGGTRPPEETPGPSPRLIQRRFTLGMGGLFIFFAAEAGVRPPPDSHRRGGGTPSAAASFPAGTAQYHLSARRGPTPRSRRPRPARYRQGEALPTPLPGPTIPPPPSFPVPERDEGAAADFTRPRPRRILAPAPQVPAPRLASPSRRAKGPHQRPRHSPPPARSGAARHGSARRSLRGGAPHAAHPAATRPAAPAPTVWALRLRPPPQRASALPEPPPSAVKGGTEGAGGGTSAPSQGGRLRGSGKRGKAGGLSHGHGRGLRGGGGGRVGAASRRCPRCGGCRLIEGKTPPRAKPTNFLMWGGGSAEGCRRGGSGVNESQALSLRRGEGKGAARPPAAPLRLRPPRGAADPVRTRE